MSFLKLNQVYQAIKQGKVLLMKTDTVWGIIAQNQEQIYQFKFRPNSKPLIQFVPFGWEQNLPSELQPLVQKFWPGALTIIVKRKSYRQPNQKELLELLQLTGPLYSSSANISGYPIAKNIQEIENYWAYEIKNQTAIVWSIENKTFNHIPSTIYDHDHKTVIREGEIPTAAILNLLK